MASETLSWKNLSYSETVPGGSQDTGAVVATVTTTAAGPGSGVYFSIDGSDPINSPDYNQDSQLYFYGDDASGTRAGLTVSFSDDTSDSVNSGVQELSFMLNDIDAGSSSSFQDEIIISAISTTGDPLNIVASPGSNFTVTNNPDGTVTLLAKSSTNSWNHAGSASEITISGGDIASFSVDFTTARNEFASNNIMMSDVKYTTATVVCFVEGTRILTPFGERNAEHLSIGDLVCTKDRGAQPLRWIGHSHISPALLETGYHLRPIRICANALGPNIPANDLLVSPQHRVVLRSSISERMFGQPEVLVAAKKLLPLPGVEMVKDCSEVNYYHLLLDHHEIIFANGTEAESLYTGLEALKGVGQAGRQVIKSLGHFGTSEPARLILRGRRFQKFLERHQRNAQPLVSALS